MYIVSAALYIAASAQASRTESLYKYACKLYIDPAGIYIRAIPLYKLLPGETSRLQLYTSALEVYISVGGRRVPDGTDI